MEGSRLTASVGLYRDVATDTTVQDGDRTLHLQKGQRIMVDCVCQPPIPSCLLLAPSPSSPFPTQLTPTPLGHGLRRPHRVPQPHIHRPHPPPRLLRPLWLGPAHLPRLRGQQVGADHHAQGNGETGEPAQGARAAGRDQEDQGRRRVYGLLDGGWGELFPVSDDVEGAVGRGSAGNAGLMATRTGRGWRWGFGSVGRGRLRERGFPGAEGSFEGLWHNVRFGGLRGCGRGGGRNLVFSHLHIASRAVVQTHVSRLLCC